MGKKGVEEVTGPELERERLATERGRRALEALEAVEDAQRAVETRIHLTEEQRQLAERERQARAEEEERARRAQRRRELQDRFRELSGKRGSQAAHVEHAVEALVAAIAELLATGEEMYAIDGQLSTPRRRLRLASPVGHFVQWRLHEILGGEFPRGERVWHQPLSELLRGNVEPPE